MHQRYFCPHCNIQTTDGSIPTCSHFKWLHEEPCVEQKMALQAHIEAGEAAITEAADLRRENYLLSINNDIFQAFIYENALKKKYDAWRDAARLISDKDEEEFNQLY